MKNLLTKDQLEVVEYHNKFGIDLTKNWFYFTVFDITPEEKEYEECDSDFMFCIQNEIGGDMAHGFEDFLPESLKGDMAESCETAVYYYGKLSREEVVEELRKSPFFTELDNN